MRNLLGSPVRRGLLFVLSGAALALAGYIAGSRNPAVVHAAAMQDATYQHEMVHGTVPKSYGKIAALIPDQIGTGLVFEDTDGTIRFVSMTGMKEGELARYEGTATHGGIPKSYGHLVGAVVNPKGTGLVFEDSAGTIRFLTLTGVTEGELMRN
jgi:hypothetical protein